MSTQIKLTPSRPTRVSITRDEVVPLKLNGARVGPPGGKGDKGDKGDRGDEGPPVDTTNLALNGGNF